MRITLATFSLLGLCACVTPEEQKVQRDKQYSEEMQYFRDGRTHLCFARVETPIYADVLKATTSVTNVPCSIEVLGLISGETK